MLWEDKIFERKDYRYKTWYDCQHQQGDQNILRLLHDLNTLSYDLTPRTLAKGRMTNVSNEPTNVNYSQYTNYRRILYCLTCRTTTFFNLHVYVSIANITDSARLLICVTSVLVALTCVRACDKFFFCFQAKPIGIMPGTGMALEVHVRGVEKVQRQEIGFFFFC